MDPKPIETMRRMVLVVLLAGIAGTATELLLTSHTELFWQQVPVALLLGALPLVLLAAVRPSRGIALATRAVMVLFIAAGGTGLWLHYQSNAEFAVELMPELSGVALLSAALTRQTPPPLAPGTMILLGLLGLIGCYGIGGRGGAHSQGD